MKRIGRILALLFCLSLSACSLMPEEEVYRSAPVTKDYEAAPYQFAAVVRGDMELTEKISLNYVPVQTEKLAFTVDGEYYDGVFVALGDSVKAGQLLAQLRVDDLLAARDACDRQIELLELSIRQLEERRALNLERVRLNADPADRSALEKALRQTNEDADDERAALEDQLTIQQAYLFPQTLITAPKSGEYLAVSYTSSGKSSDSSIQRIDDVAWAALKLEQANQYITPLSLSDVTGSDTIWSELSDMGMDWELHNGTGILLFLLPEETDLEQLNLCIFAGTESEDSHRYAQNAVAVQTVYEIPLTVTDSSDMEGMDV